jgi:cell division protein FtsL
MMAAEKWYEYQESYRRYGINMRPVIVKEKSSKPRSTNTGINPADKLRLLLLTILIGILCIGIIIASAYAASIKVNINNIIKENAVILNEIEHLNVKIESASNIQIVEAKATAELGMTYPTASQLVYIDKSEITSKDFAFVMQEQAYN